MDHVEFPLDVIDRIRGGDTNDSLKARERRVTVAFGGKRGAGDTHLPSNGVHEHVGRLTDLFPLQHRLAGCAEREMDETFSSHRQLACEYFVVRLRDNVVKRYWRIVYDSGEKPALALLKMGVVAQASTDESLVFHLEEGSREHLHALELNARYDRRSFATRAAQFEREELLAARYPAVLFFPQVFHVAAGGDEPFAADRVCLECGRRPEQSADLVLRERGSRRVTAPVVGLGEKYFDVHILSAALLRTLPSGASVPTRRIEFRRPPSRDYVQLDIDSLPTGNAYPPDGRTVECGECRALRFETYLDDWFPSVRPPSRHHGFFACDLWFGSGALSRRLIVLDSNVFRALVDCVPLQCFRPCRS
ncbi:hypothetical protein ASA1KI_03270 [Opitutales bacterium ASA1]|nr:hypothetical protein ASA1KI_03270 [Opitutales bacterium ASA1]